MKKLSLLLCVAAAIVLFTEPGNAAAVTYTNDPADIRFDSFGDSYQFTFNFGADFSSISSATLVAYLYDDDAYDNWYPDAFVIKAGSPLSTIFTSFNDIPNASTKFPSTSWDVLGYVVGGSQLTAGVSWFKLIFNDFYFDKFELTVTGTPSAPAVPIPGAAWMLGAGLIGLVAIRRRRGV